MGLKLFGGTDLVGLNSSERDSKYDWICLVGLKNKTAPGYYSRSESEHSSVVYGHPTLQFTTTMGNPY